MKKLLGIFATILFLCLPIIAQNKISGYAEKGGKVVKVSTTLSYKLMETFPSSTITVYNAGTTTIANIFSNATLSTIKANPFTANTDSYFEFYARPGTYDVKISGLGVVTPFTKSNFVVLPFNNGEKLLSSYASSSLTTAISSIGSTKTNLILDVPSSLGTIIIPDTLTLVFTPNGIITPNSGAVITIVDGNSINAGPQQIFSTTGTGVFKFLKFPEKIYPEWWGATGDGTFSSIGATDNLAAFNAMMYSISQNAAFVFASAKIVLGKNRIYDFSDTWNILTAITLEGDGGFGWQPTTILRFPVNKTGIIVNALSTFTGTSAGGDDARWTTIKGVGIFGGTALATAPTTHTVNISGLTLTKTSGTNFVNIDGYHDPNTITVNGFTYQINNFISTTQVSIKNPRIYIKLTNGVAQAEYLAQGTDRFPNVATDWTGSTFVVNGITYTISTVLSSGGSTGSGLANISPVFAGSTGNYTVKLSGVSISSGAARPNLYHGIDARGPVHLEKNLIRYFTGNGISLDSAVGLTSFPGAVPNTNISIIDGNYLELNTGNGLATKGTNSNQIRISSNNYTSNHGCGVAEFSFLGNNYFGNHSSFNTRAAVCTGLGGVNLSNFWSDYSESGQASEYYGQNMIIWGGNHGAGVALADSDMDFKHYFGGTGANGLRDNLLFATGDVPSGNIGMVVKTYVYPTHNFHILDNTDQVAIIDTAGANAFTLNFPNAAVNNGKYFKIKLKAAALGTIAFASAGGTLEVAGLTVAGDSVTLISNGTNWIILK